MKRYKIVTDKEAKQDIVEIIAYYCKIQLTLGQRFKTSVRKALLALQTSPVHQIRYRDIHCLPLEVFPYMIHFSIEEENKIVIIHAVLATKQNPDTKWL
jgi:hypothetical protein